jgi:hypothetical protein
VLRLFPDPKSNTFPASKREEAENALSTVDSEFGARPIPFAEHSARAMGPSQCYTSECASCDRCIPGLLRRSYASMQRAKPSRPRMAASLDAHATNALGQKTAIAIDISKLLRQASTGELADVFPLRKACRLASDPVHAVGSEGRREKLNSLLAEQQFEKCSFSHFVRMRLTSQLRALRVHEAVTRPTN